VNVAGTRAFVGGGFALPGGGFAFVGGGFAVVADDVLVRDVVLEVVDAAAARLVATPVVVELTDAEDVVAAEAGAGVGACVEPPHDTGIRANAITTKRRAGRLTFPG
jgi:hypothetical protein